MFIQFNHIELQNFGSVSNAEHAYESGMNFVRGVNNDDNKSNSNGSGKSTIFSEGPRWILYGDTAKGGLKDEVVNEQFGKDCYGKLHITVFHDDGTEQDVKVTRYRSHTQYKNKLIVEIDGEDFSKHGAGESQKKLEETLKLPQKVVGSIYIMEQGLEGRFSLLKNTDRKQFIEGLRDLGSWNKAYMKTKAKRDKLNGEKSSLEILMSNNNVAIQSFQSALASLKSQISDQVKVLEELNTEQAYQEKLAEFNSKKAEYTETVKLLSKVEENLNEVNTAWYNNESIWEDHRHDAQQELFNLNKEIQDLQSSLSATSCHACGREFEDAVERQKHVQPKIDELKTKLPDAQREFHNYERMKLDFEQETDDLTMKKNSLNSKIQLLFQEMTSIKGQVDQINGQKEKIQELIDKSKEKETETQSQIDQYQEKNKTISEDLKKIVDEIPYYEEILKIFSFKGIRSYLIGSDIDFLNDRLREKSSYVFTDKYIQLKPQVEDGQIKSLDIVAIMKETGTHRNFDLLSGGEKRRSDACIQLAIKDLVKNIYYVDTNLNVIDEIFEGLDQQGIGAMIELLLESSDTKACNYIISHTNINVNGRVITVVKENGLTQINSSIN